MKIGDFDPVPLLELPCVVPRARGATSPSRLPVYKVHVEDLPAGLDAIVLTSDLQGREVSGNRALGVVLAEQLHAFLPSVPIVPTPGSISPARTGVILAGDFYTSVSLHRRFGVGKVDEVWDAFAQQAAWVTGVLGNVDRLSRAARKRHPLLEGTTLRLHGLRIGGVSGIVGSAKMENRRPEAAVLKDLERVLSHEPDILVLHEGPSVPGLDLPGNSAIRTALRHYKGLVVCGHCQWRTPMAQLRNATILNTDGRCLVLLRSSSSGAECR